MIVRILESSAAPRADVSVAAQRPGQCYGRIDVLQLTAGELFEMYAIRLAADPIRNPEDFLTGRGIDGSRLAGLLQYCPVALPCMAGVQRIPRAGTLPFLSDGPAGQWSLFFEPDGRTTLITRAGDRLVATYPDGDGAVERYGRARHAMSGPRSMESLPRIALH